MLLAGEPPCAATMPMGGSPILRVPGEPATGSAGDTAGGSAWSVVGWEAASKILSGPLPGVRPGVKAPSSGLRPQGLIGNGAHQPSKVGNASAVAPTTRNTATLPPSLHNVPDQHDGRARRIGSAARGLHRARLVVILTKGSRVRCGWRIR